MKKEYEALPYENLPVSAWRYFGYQILFSIPVIGTIALIVVALSAANVNIRSFARSYFCGFFIAVAILAIAFFALGSSLELFISYLKDYLEQFATMPY
ncbi:MAG: hypothetical protein IKT32_05625 [Clostridia bacterium]|nr:hypothetical protein [Clostridia bacterium]